MHWSVGTVIASTFTIDRYTAQLLLPVRLQCAESHPEVSSAQVRVEIESLADGVDLSEPLTRARFEELVGDLLKKTLGPVKKVNSSHLSCHFVVPLTVPDRMNSKHVSLMKTHSSFSANFT